MFEVDLALYTISNTVIIFLYVKNQAHIKAYSGILVIINITPLLTRTRLSDIVNILEISLRT